MSIVNPEDSRASSEAVSVNSKRVKRGGFFFKSVMLLMIVGSAATAGYYYRQYQKIKDNPEIVSQEETQAVIAQISRLMELPGDEMPSLATVQDKEKVKDQAFFQKAENGDKLLIYTNAKKAILYRPAANKIIEVAPLLLQGNEEGTETKAAPREEVVSEQGREE